MVIEEFKTLIVGTGSRRLDILGNFVRPVRYYFSALLFACLAACVSVEAGAINVSPMAADGVLDLRDRMFDPGRIDLCGEWQVVWEEFVEPTAFFSGDALQVAFVPDDWGAGASGNRPFGKTGYATYGLRILLPATHPELALDLGSLYYGSRIYINGRLARQNGVPGVSAEDEKAAPWARSGVIRIPASEGTPDNLDLVVQLSNHIHANGGFRAAMTIGEAGYIVRGRTIDTMARLMLIGASILLALYHLILFFNRRQEWAFLSFAVFLLGIAVHGVCNLNLMSVVVPGVNVAFMLHLEYLSLVVCSLSGVMFAWHLYPEARWSPIWQIYFGFCIGSLLLIILTPTLVFTGLLPVFKLGIVSGLGITFLSLVVAVRRKLEGAWLFLISVAITATGVCYGLWMHSYEGYSPNGIVYLCMSVMILGQAAVLGRRVTSAITISEHLRSRLQEANAGLEDIVTSRTRDLKIAIEEVHAALADSRQANRVKSEFLAMMSHEIRTPMNGILGVASVLQHTNLDAKQEKLVDIVRQSGDGLLTILNDILDISKVEAGELGLEEREFDLGLLFERCITLWQPQAAEKDLSLVQNLEVPEGLVVRGDQHRLLQIVSNLVSNSIKFTETGGVRIEGTVSEVHKGAVRLTLKVIDTGIGIPVEVRDTIFQPFQQADVSTTRKYGGTGLGLSICKHLIDLMGGTIAILDNEVDGSGTVFEVVLTVAVAEAACEGKSRVSM